MSFHVFHSTVVDGRAKLGHDGKSDRPIEYVNLFDPGYKSEPLESITLARWFPTALTLAGMHGIGSRRGPMPLGRGSGLSPMSANLSGSEAICLADAVARRL